MKIYRVEDNEQHHEPSCLFVESRTRFLYKLGGRWLSAGRGIAHRLDGILRLGKQVISLSYRSVVGYWIIKIMFLSVFFARLACLLLLLSAN